MDPGTNDRKSRLHLEYEESLQLLRDVIIDERLHPKLDGRKLSWKRPAAEKPSTLELPLLFPAFVPSNDHFPDPNVPKLLAETDFARDVADHPPPCTLLLVRAGQAAMARFEERQMIERHVVRKYMVRGKQGKAQITHLKTKGKSRLGSRIRLQQSFEFFEEINSTLLEWDLDESRQDELLHYSCPVRLWPFIFESKVKPPFEKGDERLVRIPLHVHRPNLAELERIYRRLSMGVLEEPEA